MNCDLPAMKKKLLCGGHMCGGGDLCGNIAKFGYPLCNFCSGQQCASNLCENIAKFGQSLCGSCKASEKMFAKSKTHYKNIYTVRYTPNPPINIHPIMDRMMMTCVMYGCKSPVCNSINGNHVNLYCNNCFSYACKKSGWYETHPTCKKCRLGVFAHPASGLCRECWAQLI